MYRAIITIGLCALIAAPAFAVDAKVNQLSSAEAEAWICHAVPLPKQIEIKAEITAPKAFVGLKVSGENPDPVFAQIRKEFTDTCGADCGSLGQLPFLVVVQIGGEQSEPLKALDNSSQACRIIPSEDNKSLTIAALSPRGAYYGWTTVKQLIRGRSSGNMLKIPILTMTDWPDMTDRGLWGSDSTARLVWLADRKMNHLEQINARGMNPDGTFFARSKGLPEDFNVQCASYAADWVPVILHLEQVWTEDMGRLYPEMKAKNATEERALCYSVPITTQMIAEWIYILAQQSTSCEVDLWMSENLAGHCGCQCEGCKKEWHTVNEARVVTEAWKMAEQKLGKPITLYVLTSEATEGYNKRIFSILPKNARICYYHSLLTYNTIRQPMLRPYLSDHVKEGRWLGVCPNLDAWTHNNVPFSGAAFIKYRMDEFVSKGVKELLGYATPRVYVNAFNVEAAAEWAWNDKGRTTREFAYSHAVRQGYKDPEKFAEWSETLGPVAWDVYGSNWPAGQKRGQGVKVKTALRDGTLPELGYVLYNAYPTPWGNIKTERQLNDDVAAAAKSVQLAREMGIREVMYETLVVDGYIRTLRALYELKKLAPKGGAFTRENQSDARSQLGAFLAAADQVLDYLPKWEDSVAAGRDGGWTEKPVGIMKEVAADVKRIVAEMGAGAE